MKKFALTSAALATAFGLAACAPEAEEAEAPEALEMPAEETSEMTEEMPAETDGETTTESVGGLDPEGNPVDQAPAAAE